VGCCAGLTCDGTGTCVLPDSGGCTPIGQQCTGNPCCGGGQCINGYCNDPACTPSGTGCTPGVTTCCYPTGLCGPPAIKPFCSGGPDGGPICDSGASDAILPDSGNVCQ
jgi:hypothetical protein